MPLAALNKHASSGKGDEEALSPPRVCMATLPLLPCKHQQLYWLGRTEGRGCGPTLVLHLNERKKGEGGRPLSHRYYRVFMCPSSSSPLFLLLPLSTLAHTLRCTDDTHDELRRRLGRQKWHQTSLSLSTFSRPKETFFKTIRACVTLAFFFFRPLPLANRRTAGRPRNRRGLGRRRRTTKAEEIPLFSALFEASGDRRPLFLSLSSHNSPVAATHSIPPLFSGRWLCVCVRR